MLGHVNELTRIFPLFFCFIKRNINLSWKDGSARKMSNSAPQGLFIGTEGCQKLSELLPNKTVFGIFIDIIRLHLHNCKYELYVFCTTAVAAAQRIQCILPNSHRAEVNALSYWKCFLPHMKSLSHMCCTSLCHYLLNGSLTWTTFYIVAVTKDVTSPNGLTQKQNNKQNLKTNSWVFFFQVQCVLNFFCLKDFDLMHSLKQSLIATFRVNQGRGVLSNDGAFWVWKYSLISTLVFHFFNYVNKLL